MDVVTTKQIADELGITTSGVRWLVKAGRLTPLAGSPVAHLFPANWRKQYEKTARRKRRKKDTDV